MKKIYKTILSVFILSIFFSLSSFSFELNQLQYPGSNIFEENDQLLSVQKLYPNPVKDKLTVELNVKEEGEIVVIVYDILGNERIKRDVFLDHSGLNKISLNFSELHSGIYILKVEKDVNAVSARIKKQ